MTNLTKVVTFKERKPKIICLCGSTRFIDAFQEHNLKETLKGNIVLSVGCNTKSDTDLFRNMPAHEAKALKERLDELHKRKIDLCDEVLILNVGNYIGESTKSEIEYALSTGHPVRYIENPWKESVPRPDYNWDISKLAKSEPL